jgi:hypothetical protein
MAPKPPLPAVVVSRVSLPRQALLIVGVAAGCGVPAVPIDEDINPTEGFGAGDATGPGSASGEGDGADGVDSTGSDAPRDACLFLESATETRFAHQCKGYVSVAFGAAGAMLPETKYFGFEYGEDSYSEPLVMACCDPFDPATHSFCGDGYEYSCAMDLVQTMCISLVHRLNAAGEEAEIGSSQIFALANWVNDNQDACHETFILDTGIWALPNQDTCAPVDVMDMLETTWYIPNSNDWPDLMDPFITLDVAEVTDIYIPNDGTALECTGLTAFNAGVSFLEIEPVDPSELEMVLQDGMGMLAGPELDGEPVIGYGSLRSLATGCGPGQCSNARFHDKMDGTWDLTGLWLYEASSSVVGNRSTTMTVDSYNIALERTVTGSSPRHGLYEIDAGRARFVVGATAAGSGASLRATNTSTISLRESDVGWYVLPFSIGYVDAEGKTWSLTVGQTSWSFAQ